jgi:hypothetical protein
MSNLGLNRNPSFSSSVSSSRTPSVSSRHTSNGSFSSSVGPGGRPQTSMSFNQSTSRRPASAAPKSRPATAMDNHYNDPGMRPLNSFTSSFPYIQEKSGLQSKKSRPVRVSRRQLSSSADSISYHSVFQGGYIFLSCHTLQNPKTIPPQNSIFDKRF